NTADGPPELALPLASPGTCTSDERRTGSTATPSGTLADALAEEQAARSTTKTAEDLTDAAQRLNDLCQALERQHPEENRTYSRLDRAGEAVKPFNKVSDNVGNLGNDRR